MTILTNPIFLTIIISSLGAQLIKTIIFLIESGHVHKLDIIATGGMPSSHSALVTGLSVIIYLTEGASTAFFLALSVGMIIIVDAMGVRRTVGEEGLLLHKIIKKTKLQIKEPHISMGHTGLQVIVGMLLGLVVAVVVNALV